jgi:two-component system response regulator NreC
MSVVQTSEAVPESGETEPIRIVLADDHEVVRTGLRLLLDAEPDLSVVAEAADIEATARYVLGHHPDVLVLDLNMGEDSSLPLIPKLVAEHPETRIVVLTMQSDPAFARAALSTGALGYVLKQAAGDELVQAVRLAAAGEVYLNPRLGAQMAAAPSTTAGPPDDLSDREVEVLRLLALGHTNAEIAEQLILSVRTIESHRANIQSKSGSATRAELVRYALDHNLVE